MNILKVIGYPFEILDDSIVTPLMETLINIIVYILTIVGIFSGKKIE